jgi:hypothetical protein
VYELTEDERNRVELFKRKVELLTREQMQVLLVNLYREMLEEAGYKLQVKQSLGLDDATSSLEKP